MGQFERQIIETQAHRFRANHELGNGAIDFKSLLLRLNILTMFRPLSEVFSGMCLKDQASDSRFMLINSNMPLGRQNFTIAHELYHLYYDNDFAPHICNLNASKSPSEKKADAFAAALLMPEIGISALIADSGSKSPISLATIIRIEQYYSVSRQALLVRLKDLKFITAEQQNVFTEQPVRDTARCYGYSTALYEKGNEGLVIGDYGEIVRTLFDAGKISESHYLKLLNKIQPDNDGPEN